MIYKYEHFIPQNIAPKGTKSIEVYDSEENNICSIALGKLTPPTKNKLYSFGLLSDIHLYKASWVTWNPNEKFDNALTYFESKGCAMCIVAGDLTQTGFYMRTDENDPSTTYLDESQFAAYKEVCDNHTIPVYELMGNHENYYGMPMSNSLDKLEYYTRKGMLSYKVEQGNDIFILVGQPEDVWVMSDEDFEWLETTLEANKDKRCFIFVHSYIEEDSGDAKDFRENSIFEYWNNVKSGSKKAFVELLNKHKNVILFHGHSHIKFEYQEIDKSANYTVKTGFKSVHIPSLGRPRDVNINGTSEKEKTPHADDEAQGYLVDVYDDCIVLNGMDFINNLPVPLGVLKIDTIIGGES